jgi:hypothetical protein
MTYSKDKNTAYSRKWRHQALKVLVDAMGGGCRVCGYNKCLSALDFHHVDRSTKEVTVSSLMVKKGWKNLVLEARKCVLVCCRCHREIHHDLLCAPELLEYNIQDHLFGDNNCERNPSWFNKKQCPDTTDKFRELRKEKSLRVLAIHYSVNTRTVMRWCKEML